MIAGQYRRPRDIAVLGRFYGAGNRGCPCDTRYRATNLNRRDAIKYRIETAEAAGSTIVGLRQDRDRAVLAIADTGHSSGLKTSRAFDRIRSVSGPRCIDARTGDVKGIVEMYRATIEVSGSPGGHDD